MKCAWNWWPRAQLNGKREVSTYFTNYSSMHDWHFVPGLVDGRPAAIVRDVTGAPAYFVLFAWSAGQVVTIRDFRHARYAVEGAELTIAA